jgi:hypothetical protein
LEFENVLTVDVVTSMTHSARRARRRTRGLTSRGAYRGVHGVDGDDDVADLDDIVVDAREGGARWVVRSSARAEACSGR